MRTFPIPKAYNYGYEPGFSDTHQGVDIFAAKGTPVVAVESGKAYSRIENKGGKVAYLEGDDGLVYFYGHLDTWDLKLMRGTKQPVQAGDPIGFVGNTGNAQGTQPHVHFQMRRGSTVLNPYDALVAVDSGAAGGELEIRPGIPLPLLALAFLSLKGGKSSDWTLPALLLLASRSNDG